jgi:hypothetical protein
MKQRIFAVALCAMLFALCLHAEAQQAKKIPRVGFLWDSPGVFPDALEAFRQGLRDLGYVEIGLTIPPNVLARADRVIK